MKHLDGKPAAVTGAASGIGLALSHGFAARGMNVVMADINADTLHATARQVRAAPVTAAVLPSRCFMSRPPW